MSVQKNVVLSSLMAVLLMCAIPSWAVDEQRKIMVTGDGEVAIAADMAVVSLTVRKDAETAEKALQENSAAMKTVLQAMMDAGVAQRDLQTSQFSIKPRYIYPRSNNADQLPRLAGYTVSNSLSVRVRDIDSLGVLLDRAVKLGVNEGGSIQFVNKDPAAAIEKARIQAVKDAMNKARTLAGAAGVKLGDLLQLSEQQSHQYPMPMAAKAGFARSVMEDSVPVASGENTYSVRVNVTYAIAS